jgi:hypothetical protein
LYGACCSAGMEPLQKLMDLESMLQKTNKFYKYISNFRLSTKWRKGIRRNKRERKRNRNRKVISIFYSTNRPEKSGALRFFLV